ncbi:uncharacterized protein WM277_025452 [Molossus nigricans]
MTHRPRPLPPSSLAAGARGEEEASVGRTADLSACSRGARSLPGATASSAVAQAPESAISGPPPCPVLAARAPLSLGVGRTRRRWRREETRGERREQRTKEGPRGGGSATSACGSYPLPARGGGGGGSRGPGSPISEASARPHRAGVARNRGTAPGCSCRAGGGLAGTGTPRGSGEARAGRGWRHPGEGSPPAQETQRRRRHPVVVARASAPCAPGLLPNPPSGTIPGVRPPGVGTQASGPGPPSRESRSPLAAAPDVGSPTRGDKEAVAASPAPTPHTPPAPRSLLGGAVEARGSVQGPQGEGPACPAEGAVCMTQWFLEKALLGFPERGLCLARGGGPVGPELVLKPAGTWAWY